MIKKKLLNNTLVLIPAFNEEETIKKVIGDLSIYFPNILLINDASTDKTLEIATKTNSCTIINHCVNCGQGTALSTGIKYFLNYTNLEFLITFDADDQHQVSDAIKMLNYSEKNKVDANFGSRFIGARESNLPLIRSIFLQISTFIQRILFGINMTDAHNGLRVLSRNACTYLSNLNSSYMAHATEIPYLLIKAGVAIYEHPCKIKYTNPSKSSSLFTSLNILSELLQNK